MNLCMTDEGYAIQLILDPELGHCRDVDVIIMISLSPHLLGKNHPPTIISQYLSFSIPLSFSVPLSSIPLSIPNIYTRSDKLQNLER